MKLYYFQFIKLFERLEEGQGATNTIIAYRKAPCGFKSIYSGDGKFEEVVTRYAYRVHVNLFIVAFGVEFKGFFQKHD